MMSHLPPRGRGVRGLILRLLGVQQRRRSIVWTPAEREAVLEARAASRAAIGAAAFRSAVQAEKDDDLETFERGFSTLSAGCRRTCVCGREFYNPGGGWDFEDGELEELENDPKATALEWAAGAIYLEGGEYAMDCDCWRERASIVVAWIKRHDREIASFLTEEKKKLTRAADQAPTVKEVA